MARFFPFLCAAARNAAEGRRAATALPRVASARCRADGGAFGESAGRRCSPAECCLRNAVQPPRVRRRDRETGGAGAETGRSPFPAGTRERGAHEKVELLEVTFLRERKGKPPKIASGRFPAVPSSALKRKGLSEILFLHAGGKGGKKRMQAERCCVIFARGQERGCAATLSPPTISPPRGQGRG